MLLEKETLEKLGHAPSNLSKSSGKLVYVECDYCNTKFTNTMKRFNIGREVVQKDACKSCRFKKREDVSLAKYGVKNSSQRKYVKDKIRDANIDRLKSEEYKEQVKETNMKKFGVENAMQNNIIKEKLKSHYISKFGVDNPSKVKDIKLKATKSMIETKKANGTIKTYEGKTRPELAKEQGFSRSHFGKLVVKHGIDKALDMTPHESCLERRFREWLDSENIKYERQFRVDSKIADFKIDNIIVELDGLYWHSEWGLQDRVDSPAKYHSEKRQLYIDNGYFPFFFREDELVNKFSIIKSMVLHKLNKHSNRVFARKCSIGTTSKEFFDNNHLMGRGYGTIFSLEYEGKVVAAIQIRRLKNKEYEISRFCTALHTNVVGGFSKLLKYVERSINMDSLKTFIDLRYGVGDYLEDLGFTRGTFHVSFKWTNGTDSIHRLKYRGNSGYDEGFSKIWDCGQLPFLKQY